MENPGQSPLVDRESSLIVGYLDTFIPPQLFHSMANKQVFHRPSENTDIAVLLGYMPDVISAMITNYEFRIRTLFATRLFRGWTYQA